MEPTRPGVVEVGFVFASASAMVRVAFMPALASFAALLPLLEPTSSNRIGAVSWFAVPRVV
jgi:hypothetical protein